MRQARFIVLLFLFLAHLGHAADQTVVEWTQKTLLQSLTIDYTVNKKTLAKTRSSYSQNAWNALNNFLGHYFLTIKDNHLTLHPQLLGPAKVIESAKVKNSNFFSGVRFWRIHQLIRLPELQTTVAFTTLVIATSDAGYLITSLDMSLQSDDS